MQLEKKRLFNEDGERDWGERRIVGGNSSNLIELNHIKYEWAYKMYRAMMNNFWIPEEIPLAQDAKDYQTKLSTGEKRAYHKILSFLIFLDSIQTNNLPNINDYITAPEVNLCLSVHAFQEAVHSQSYGYILESVVTPEIREQIYQEWRDDPHLLKRNRFITDLYEAFLANPTEKQLIKTMMANYILEGIYFYSGFSFFFALARMEKMMGTATEIKYIQRDELTHLALFQAIFQELRRENSSWFTQDLIEELRGMMAEAVEHEIAWGQYVMNEEIPGLTNEAINLYIRYLGNQRLERLGLEPLYPEVKDHPLRWVERFNDLNGVKTDFFEQKVTNYSKAGNLDWDDL
ncbi:ribonucleotide-diphosphate reductase subunit beta [Rubeoparvulum massiliense]|uniref:ribonucleotide-diphosphate reductase subunit beta n=1 Tax=Rubeoparvulum massiliense TaxID=1631346 RepID=UPI00065E1BFE|nr:ribonucleotide-diphosphate reductase subunit beta [Rubeoparvulum massiliense]